MWGPSFLLHFILRPSVHQPPLVLQHTPADQHRMLYFIITLICFRLYQGVENILEFQFYLSNLKKKEAEEKKLLRFKSMVWHFSTNFSHRQLFIAEQDWVCLPHCQWKQRSVWWCLMIDMNEHLYSFSLYMACYVLELPTLGHVWFNWMDKLKILHKMSISCGLLLSLTGNGGGVLRFSLLTDW